MAFGKCKQCGGDLPPRGRSGPPREYCSPRCRTDAYRDRVAAASVAASFEPAGGGPAVLPDLPLAWNGGADGDVEDQLAQALIETRTLADHYARLANHLPPALAQRAAKMSDLLNAALGRIFGGIA